MASAQPEFDLDHQRMVFLDEVRTLLGAELAQRLKFHVSHGNPAEITLEINPLNEQERATVLDKFSEHFRGRQTTSILACLIGNGRVCFVPKDAEVQNN